MGTQKLVAERGSRKIMAMENINNILGRQTKLRRFQKPLQAAYICDIARGQASGRYEIISFKQGLLTLGVQSPGEASNLQSESPKIIDSINKKIGKEEVQRIRFRII